MLLGVLHHCYCNNSGGAVGGVPCLGVLKAFFTGVDGWRRGGCPKHGYGAAQELDVLIAQHLATSAPCRRVLLPFVCQCLDPCRKYRFGVA